MKNILLLFFFFPSVLLAKIDSIYDTSIQRFISLNKLVKEHDKNSIFVLGEFHNISEIQSAQAQLIEKFVNYYQLQNDFSLFWEFLNFTDQKNISKKFKMLLENQITDSIFITETAGSQNLTYLPLIKTIKAYRGDIHGINLPREIKQKVIKEGIESVDSTYISPYHYNGDEHYYERFLKVMGDHVPAHMLFNYFEAQCLTDSTMAYQVSKNLKGENTRTAQFIVAGSFHTDFFGATVVRLQKLTAKKIITFKFISKSHLSKEEVETIKNNDPNYGQYAHYIVITD